MPERPPAQSDDRSEVSRLLVEATRELLCLHDVNGTFLFVSPSSLPLLGYTPEDLLGRDPFEIVYEDDRAVALEGLAAVLSGDEQPVPLTCRFRRADGEFVWLEIRTQALRDGEGKISRLVTSSRDVSDHVHLVRRLAHREATLRSVFEALDDLLFVLDAEGRFREYFQPAGRPELYRTPEEFLGRLPAEVLPPAVATTLERAIRRAHRNPRVQELDYELPAGGETRTFHAKLTPILQTAGIVAGFVVVSRDVTARRMAEEERVTLVRASERAERMEGLATLARGTAHEFNNLLTSIQGNLGLAMEDLLESDGDEAGIAPAVSAALEATRRAADVTRRLLTYVGESRGEPVLVDAQALLEAIAGELGRDGPWLDRVSLQVDPEAGTLVADPGQLRSAVGHLIRNALEAVGGADGRIEVLMGSRTLDTQTLQGSRIRPAPTPGRFLSVEVRDNGPGISENVVDRLFDPFVSTRFLGRGLGLAEVAGIVRAHRGAILVRSEQGEGTAIELLFPQG